MRALTVLPKMEFSIDREGSVGALLFEYKKVLDELVKSIVNLNEFELGQILDRNAVCNDYISVKSILDIIIKKGYAGVIYIQRHKRNTDDIEIPAIKSHFKAGEYIKELNAFYNFLLIVMNEISDDEIVQLNPSDKLKTPDSQLYDYEQLLEHLIVDTMRNCTRIEKFKMRMI